MGNCCLRQDSTVQDETTVESSNDNKPSVFSKTKKGFARSFQKLQCQSSLSSSSSKKKRKQHLPFPVLEDVTSKTQPCHRRPCFSNKYVAGSKLGRRRISVTRSSKLSTLFSLIIKSKKKSPLPIPVLAKATRKTPLFHRRSCFADKCVLRRDLARGRSGVRRSFSSSFSLVKKEFLFTSAKQSVCLTEMNGSRLLREQGIEKTSLRTILWSLRGRNGSWFLRKTGGMLKNIGMLRLLPQQPIPVLEEVPRMTPVLFHRHPCFTDKYFGRMCYEDGLMDRDLSVENFLVVNKEENAPLQVVDLGMSMTLKPEPWLQTAERAHIRHMMNRFKKKAFRDDCISYVEFAAMMKAETYWRKASLLYHRPHITEKYVLGRELGRGQFGVTYLCIDSQTNEAFACKVISKRNILDIEDLRREVAIMSMLSAHKNFAKLRAVYEDIENVHLVMELCAGGELYDRIVANGYYGEQAAANIMRTIAEVVKTCHDNGIMHRDLKPENFLFVSKEENSVLKVIDFGMSTTFKPGEKFLEVMGSPFYMAPELLMKSYGPEIDIWSAGVILYILLCGVPPFWAETNQGIALAILRGVIDFETGPWQHVSKSAKNLVRLMLEQDPCKRLTAQQVLDHPWLQNAKKAQTVLHMMNTFKKKALRVIEEHLSVEVVGAIRYFFTSMDTDCNSVVTYQELSIGLWKVGLQFAESEIKMLMKRFDLDGDGVLDYWEFVALEILLLKLENFEHFGRAFMTFDMDGSGFIELGDLREALKEEFGEIDKDVLIEIMREVDTNKDGRISYAEFVAMTKVGTDWRKAS